MAGAWKKENGGWKRILEASKEGHQFLGRALPLSFVGSGRTIGSFFEQGGDAMPETADAQPS